MRTSLFQPCCSTSFLPIWNTCPASLTDRPEIMLASTIAPLLALCTRSLGRLANFADCAGCVTEDWLIHTIWTVDPALVQGSSRRHLCGISFQKNRFQEAEMHLQSSKSFASKLRVEHWFTLNPGHTAPSQPTSRPIHNICMRICVQFCLVSSIATMEIDDIVAPHRSCGRRGECACSKRQGKKVMPADAKSAKMRRGYNTWQSDRPKTSGRAMKLVAV